MESIIRYLLLQSEIKMTWNMKGKSNEVNLYLIYKNFRQITSNEAQSILGDGVLYVMETSAAESQDSIDILLASAIKVSKVGFSSIQRI